MIVKTSYLSLAGALALVSALPAPDAVGPNGIEFLKLSNPDAFPCDMALGSDNNIYTYSPLTSKLIKIDTAKSSVTEYVIPGEPRPTSTSGLPVYDGKPYLPCAVRSSPDGNIYAINGEGFDVIIFNPKTEAIEVAPAGVSGDVSLSDICPTTTATYFTLTNQNVLVAQTKKGVTSYTLETSPGQDPPIPLGLFSASDDALWFTTTQGKSVGYLDPKTKAVKLYGLGDSKCIPAYIRAESDGILYFTCFNDDAIMGINMKTGAFSSFNTDGFPSDETLDSTGTIFYTDTQENTLSAHNPETGSTAVYALPKGSGKPATSPFNFLIGVQYLPSKNRIYFSQPDYNRVGFLQLAKGM